MLNTLAKTLKIHLKQALLNTFSQLSEEDLDIEITQSTQVKFGHYQTNIAMRYAKLLKDNPRKIATLIVASMEESMGHLLDKIEIAGPGFINMTLKQNVLEEMSGKLFIERGALFKDTQQKRIVVDFSSPNIAKEMHVGHLRSTVIGDCLAKVLEFLGHSVLRLNHVGDFGTAFGMLISYMRIEAPSVLDGTKQASLSDLVSWYRASKKKFDEDPDFKKVSQLAVVEFQRGDKDATFAWKKICEISRIAFEEIYNLLDVEIIERGESYYSELLLGVVEDLEEKGVVEISGGAKCVYPEGFKNREGDPFPLIIQKSDGGYNYASTDLAAIKHRVNEEKADRIIYVTDLGQATHFKMVFEVARIAGYYNPDKVELNHVPFGLVLGADGKKFKTRSGETERLMDLIENSIKKAHDILEARALDFPKEELDQLAEKLGVNAIKYADLSNNRIGDYSFSYDKMLQFEGNTAAFLMYSYVRILGIQRKTSDSQDLSKVDLQLDHESERALVLHLLRFGETLEKVARDLLPNRLSDYLYELSQKFNHFFRDCHVKGNEYEASRLKILDLTAFIMKTGMQLLGLKVASRM